MYNIRKSILGDIYMYKSTTYKINNFTKRIYEALYMILRNDKDSFTEMLMDENLGKDAVEKFSLYQFNELIQSMVKQLEIKIKRLNLTEVKIAILSNPRIKELKEIYNLRFNDNKTTHIAFRISKEEKERISNLKDKRLGEVIEIAILLYIHELDNEKYNLLLKTFKYDK